MTKYAHLFNRPGRSAIELIEDQFLFCSNLGSGATGSAQLVLHVASNTPCVRKTVSPRLTLEQMDDEYNTVERRVLEYLQSQPDNDRPPHLNGLWYRDDIYPRAGGRPFRILYLEYCNGGDLQQLHDFLAYNNRGMARRLILRFVKQMATALNYLYTRAEPILHRDFKMANVFCQWTSAGVVDFYLGDFSFASMSNTSGALEDLIQFADVIQSLADLRGPQPGVVQDTQDLHNLLNQIYQEIRTRGDDSMREDQLPDLTQLMRLVAQIPDEEVAEPWREYNSQNAHLQTTMPCYYDTREDCLRPHMRGTAVHGPWYVSSVSPNGAESGLELGVAGEDLRIRVTISTGDEIVPQTPVRPRVVNWESEWHHRPNPDSDDPLSEDEVEVDDM